MKKILFILIFVLGIFLRTKLYFFDRSLWLDEAALALNIIDGSFSSFLGPLMYAQSAPPLFLAFVKLLTSIFGPDEKVLRFLPYLASVLSLFGFYFLLKEFLKNKYVIAGALFVFALSPVLLYNTIEFKPYTFDVLLGILSLFIAVKFLNKKADLKTQIVCGLILSSFCWASFGCLFINASVFLICVFRKNFVLSSLLALNFLVFYFIVGANLKDGAAVYNYWKPYFINYKIDMILPVFLSSLKYVFAPVFLPVLGLFLIAFGSISLFINDKYKTFVLILPVFGALAASFLNIYPFASRLILFLLPIYLILIFIPLENVKNKIVYSFLILLFLSLNLFNLFGVFKIEKYYREESVPLFNYVKSHALPNDTLFLFHGSHLAFRYYSRFYDFKNPTIVTGPKEDSFKKLNESCKQNTCWIIFTQEEDRQNNTLLLNDWVKKRQGKEVLNVWGSILYKIEKKT